MNKSEAKRLACRLTAGWIQNRMDDANDVGEDLSVDDSNRLYRALEELIDEMYRRGTRRQ